MEEKILHIKKIENPNFSDLSLKGKKLIDCINYRKFPIELCIGEVKVSSGNHDSALFYLDGFTMVESTFGGSLLEKQSILGREYFGHHPYYEAPLLFDKKIMKKDVFYEFKEDVKIDELRDICNGKEQRLIIRELK